MPPPRRDLSDDGYRKAIEWFRRRVPMTPAQFSAVEDAYRERSFTIAGIAQLRLVDSVMRSVAKAIEGGESLGKFKQRVSGVLHRAWGESRPHRIEAIYRTETQRAYMRGRHTQLTQPRVLNLRPFWIYDAILDSRTSDLCRALDGTIRDARDRFWDAHLPPLHVNCRSGIRALRRSDVAAKGGATRRLPRVEVPDGFGRRPDEEPEQDLEGVDPGLLDEHEAKT